MNVGVHAQRYGTGDYNQDHGLEDFRDELFQFRKLQLVEIESRKLLVVGRGRERGLERNGEGVGEKWRGVGWEGERAEIILHLNGNLIMINNITMIFFRAGR